MLAKDDESDSSGSESSGSDHADGGSDSSGDNSGDANGGSDNSGSGSGNSGSGSGTLGTRSDQDNAREAVTSGKAMPLYDALRRLGTRYPGRVINIDLQSEGRRLVYRFKVKGEDGNVRKVLMDAKTGKFRGIFGF